MVTTISRSARSQEISHYSGLRIKTIALLDDWRFDETVLPISAQLLWHEGKPLPLTRPQNQQSYVGHFLYKGGAPIFITTNEEDFAKTEASAEWAIENNQPSQHTRLLQRLTTYKLSVPTPVPHDVDIFECPTCFARMIEQHSRDTRGASASSSIMPPQPQRRLIFVLSLIHI